MFGNKLSEMITLTTDKGNSSMIEKPTNIFTEAGRVVYFM